MEFLRSLPGVQDHRSRRTMRHSRVAIGLLIVLNAVVLLGQVWPEGAPPFARAVNIAFLAVTLVYFVSRFLARQRHTDPPRDHGA